MRRPRRRHCNVSFDVTGIVRHWYTSKGSGLEPEPRVHDPQLQRGHERTRLRHRHSRNGRLPSLARDQLRDPQVQMDFPIELGADYALGDARGATTTLPLNGHQRNSNFTFNSAVDADSWVYKLGYRWFDAKGAAGHDIDHAVCGPVGGYPRAGRRAHDPAQRPRLPATAGVYTLRLDPNSRQGHHHPCGPRTGRRRASTSARDKRNYTPGIPAGRAPRSSSAKSSASTSAPAAAPPSEPPSRSRSATVLWYR